MSTVRRACIGLRACTGLRACIWFHDGFNVGYRQLLAMAAIRKSTNAAAERARSCASGGDRRSWSGCGAWVKCRMLARDQEVCDEHRQQQGGRPGVYASAPLIPSSTRHPAGAAPPIQLARHGPSSRRGTAHPAGAAPPIPQSRWQPWAQALDGGTGGGGGDPVKRA